MANHSRLSDLHISNYIIYFYFLFIVVSSAVSSFIDNLMLLFYTFFLFIFILFLFLNRYIYFSKYSCLFLMLNIVFDLVIVMISNDYLKRVN